MDPVGLLGLAAGGLASLGAAEHWVHRSRLKQIPIRIHISGTRGKSSVTRLIFAGMRAAGKKAAAKTTGTLARVILPDARELPVFRPAGPNVIEQIRVTKAAHALGVEALILECMALNPYLHWLSENKLVRATHGVITNARPDHLDVMGPTDADVAKCLAGMIPVKGTLVTAERKHLSTLEAAAKDRGTKLIAVTEADVAKISDEDMQGFGYVEHKENVALALSLLADLDIPRDVALSGMHNANPDPGALTETLIDFFGKRIVFVNAFAANDPDSTSTIWNMFRERHQDVDRVIAVVNLRADRPTRTIQLAQAPFWRSADHVILIGSGTYLFAKEAVKQGFPAGRFVYSEHATADRIFEDVIAHCGESNLVMGMANMGGMGLELNQHFRNRGVTSRSM